MTNPVDIHTARRWFKALDAREPLTQADDPRYVDFDRDNLRGSGPACRDRLANNIWLREPAEPSCQLFSGFPGTGKTTELHRLRALLEGRDNDEAAVVLINGLDYLDQHVPPTITDLLRVLAWHLDRAATDAEGKDPDEEPGYRERLWNWLQSDVEIRQVGLGAYGASLMAEIKDNPSFRERARLVLDLRFQQFANEAHEVITASVQRLRAAMGRPRVVVLFDGLEKLKASTQGESASMEQAVEALFCTHARWLQLEAHAVYTFPLWLRYRRADLGTLYGATPVVLPMVKVAEPGGLPHDKGIDRMIEMVGQRVDPLDAAFGPDPRAMLRPMVLASGGYPRDLLRLARDAVREAFPLGFPVGDPTRDRVIRALAEEYRLVVISSDRELLRRIATDHAIPPGLREVQTCSRLFDLLQVLTYRNGDEWHDVHPLVRRALDLGEE